MSFPLSYTHRQDTPLPHAHTVPLAPMLTIWADHTAQGINSYLPAWGEVLFLDVVTKRSTVDTSIANDHTIK